MKKRIRKSVVVSGIKVGKAKNGLGLGMFATKEFKKGDFLAEYGGYLISLDEANRKGGRYLFDVSSRTSIDGTPRWNKTRYFNHSCKPNAEAIDKSGHIKLYSKKRILIGDEITYNYGREYVKGIIEPDGGCKCGFCK